MAESTDPTTAVPNLYHPLDADKQELRLLELCPSDDSDSPIQVKIFPCRLEDVRGQFIPFSYVWGDPTVTETIIINGVPRKVTKNLAFFLRQIRTILPQILASISWESPTLFWADAICINQDDTEERNRQVQLMGSIYGSAPAALAWLGQAENSHLTAKLVDAFEIWLDACEEGHRDATESQDYDPNFDGWMERHPDLWSFSAVSGGGRKRNPYWEAINTLLHSPYWSRIWIFQEITLPDDTLFVYGSALIRLYSLRALVWWMVGFASKPTYNVSFLDQENYQDLLIAVRQVISAVGSSIKSPLATKHRLATPQRPTLALVPELAILRASDPRDKIFGLLGVMDTHLVADYNKPAIQIYCEFVSAWMREIQDLNFLLDAYRMPSPVGQTGLPSWAPDWGAISWALNTMHETAGGFPMGHFLSQRNLQASAHLPADHTHISQSCRILTATGVLCDEVEEVYPAWRNSQGALAIGTSFLDLVQRHTDRSRRGGRGCSRRHILQILFRTALHDTSPISNTVRLMHSEAAHLHTWGFCFLSYIAMCYLASDDPSALQPNSIVATFLPSLGIPNGTDFLRFWREEIFGDVELTELDEVHWQDAVEALWWAWENHRAEFETIQVRALHTLAHSLKFLTKNNYMGLASSAEVGDKVVVLAGCKAPVLLRPKDGHYEHISACFVVDLMDGEAKEMVDRGEAKLERFEIH
ncbi:HET domain-containing protein [Fusarium falciforme]|uniref:HET domain-containing protein n=1 Tax=Fusarium falciforme TaxID=195108 RepID=UPI00230076E5|nr:HET domain-containing protein [Fusarium falciforme]WAO87562.1 HET domain-containing protein [Fusarium falciforme]